MSDKAVFQASYADLKLVKTRKVSQIVLEIPIERTGAFVAAFGIPDPSAETPVAIARINTAKTTAEKVAEAVADAHERKRFSDLRPSAQAALRCKEPGFRRFLSEQYGRVKADTDENAADAVRKLCGVKSRSELDNNDPAATCWQGIEQSYEAWRLADAHGFAA